MNLLLYMVSDLYNESLVTMVTNMITSLQGKAYISSFVHLCVIMH
jgi:hypothetical protein